MKKYEITANGKTLQTYTGMELYTAILKKFEIEYTVKEMDKEKIEREIMRLKTEIVMDGYNGWNTKEILQKQLKELEEQLNSL
jgi:replicative DNA helicase